MRLQPGPCCAVRRGERRVRAMRCGVVCIGDRRDCVHSMPFRSYIATGKHPLWQLLLPGWIRVDGGGQQPVLSLRFRHVQVDAGAWHLCSMWKRLWRMLHCYIMHMQRWALPSNPRQRHRWNRGHMPAVRTASAGHVHGQQLLARLYCRH